MSVRWAVQPVTWQSLARDVTHPEPGCLCHATASVTLAVSSRCSKARWLLWTWRSWSAQWLLRNSSWKRRQVKCPPGQATSLHRVLTGPGCFLLATAPAPWDGLHPVTEWARTKVLAQGAEYHLPCRRASNGERRGRSRPLPAPE